MVVAYGQPACRPKRAGAKRARDTRRLEHEAGGETCGKARRRRMERICKAVDLQSSKDRDCRLSIP